MSTTFNVAVVSYDLKMVDTPNGLVQNMAIFSRVAIKRDEVGLSETTDLSNKINYQLELV